MARWDPATACDTLRHKRLDWWAVALAATVAAVVAIWAATADAQERCGVPAAPLWTPIEIAVWRQLCAGEWADLNAAGEILDPKGTYAPNRSWVSTYIHLSAGCCTRAGRCGVWGPNPSSMVQRGANS